MQQLVITLNSGTIGLISVLLAIFVSGLAIVAHFRQRKNFFREEGKAVEKIEALKLEVAELTAWRAIVEAKNHVLDLAVVRIDENLKYIKESVDDLKRDARSRQDQ